MNSFLFVCFQKFTQGKLTNKSGGDKCTPKRNNSISPARHIHRHQHVKKKDKVCVELFILWFKEDDIPGIFLAYFIADIGSYSQLKIESIFPNSQEKIPN